MIDLTKKPRTLRVLIVADSFIAAQAEKKLLEAVHCQVDLVTNANEAIDNICTNKYPYEFSVIDSDLRGMSGLRLANFIRKHLPDLRRRLPIIILAAHDNEEQKQKAREIGCNGFLLKPLTNELCQELVNRLVWSY